MKKIQTLDPKMNAKTTAVTNRDLELNKALSADSKSGFPNAVDCLSQIRITSQFYFLFWSSLTSSTGVVKYQSNDSGSSELG